MTDELRDFDPLGDLPSPGITVLEASAGTGKTWVVAALVARYVAEGRCALEDMLVITFGRAASQELRDRVRAQLVEVERALADPGAARAAEGLVGKLAGGFDDAEIAARRRRVGDALASYDAATIATIHQFCQQVLRSLGVAGDTDTGAGLVESLHELTEQVVDDVYLQRFRGRDKAPFDREVAMRLGRAVVEDPQAAIAPVHPEPGSFQAERVEFARAVRDEVELRKRRLGVLSYDDLLSRLADALEPADSAARQRMRQRWKVVLVDEFQDTDPVQWNVLSRAFRGPDLDGHEPTMVLIGDPKQAIYAFRGGDIYTYLEARDEAEGRVQTLATNWRSDQALVDALQRMLGGVELGDPRIVVHPVTAHHEGSRLVDPPSPAPVRLRLVAGRPLGANDKGTVGIGLLRQHIAADMADDIAHLLNSGTSIVADDGRTRPVTAGDVAILMSNRVQVQLFRDELSRRGIASVITSGSNVLLGPSADEWVALLEAMAQPGRTGRIRALGLTSFVGLTPAELDAGGDDLTDDLAEQVRRWIDLFRTRGVAAVFEAMRTAGLGPRVLALPDGERRYTDLHHLAQVLHETSQRHQLGLAALLDWLRTERAAADANERTRRLDTDAAAVQIVTIHGSKGLQYPFVYLPTKFDQRASDGDTCLFHDAAGHRMRDVGGGTANLARARAEDAAEELRDTYVALTRAKHQVVMWWAPSYNAPNSGLTRLLLGRRPGETTVGPVASGTPDDEARSRFREWEEHGALSLEESIPRNLRRDPVDVDHGPLLPLRLRREIDTEWKRTSYSGLIRAEEQLVTEVVEPGVDSEPEVPGTTDEDLPEDAPIAGPADGSADLPSPMADLPAGATFGSLVHGVLEHADPQAPDLAAEIRQRVVEEMRWWSVDATVEELTEGLLPLHTTSLGPLADGLTLVDLGRRDRLCELDFEFPLNGGDRRDAPPTIRLEDVAGVLRRHLPEDDPMRAYADRLEVPSLGGQELRGYLSGSIDVVLRVPGERFLVVDYKTNLLGGEGPLTAMDYRPSAMTEAMLHSHYPLQALLYSVVLHRYLRWRLAGYDPERHLGGILYLYVRGMCGPETPEVDGQPCGVFSWKPPAAMILELSDLLDGAGHVR